MSIGQFPIDRAVEHLFAQRGPPPDAPRVKLVGQRSQVCGDVQGGAGIQCHPEEPGELGGGQLGQAVGLGGHVREALAAGHRNQSSGVVVGPRVVGAGEPFRGAAPRRHLRLAVQADVVERLDRSAGRSGQQDRSAHHRFGAERTGFAKFGHVADQLRAGHQHGPVTIVALNRGVFARIDSVLPGREVRGVVAGQLQRSSGQVNQLVTVHRVPLRSIVPSDPNFINLIVTAVMDDHRRRA